MALVRKCDADDLPFNFFIVSHTRTHSRAEIIHFSPERKIRSERKLLPSGAIR